MLRHGFFIEGSILKGNYQVFLEGHVYNAGEINPEIQNV